MKNSTSTLFVLFTYLIFLFLNASLFAQVTTGSLKGMVKNGTQMLPDAHVILTNKATGEQYHTQTNARGNYSFFNLNPSRQYEIEVMSESGVIREAVIITLGQDVVLDLDFTTLLDEVTVVSKKSRGQDRSGGASTVVRAKTIIELPSFNRSIQDITQLTPQSTGLAMAGSNPRFNNITIDGAVATDPFGLSGSGGLPGARTNTQPISLDAIEEMQVVLSPYNVQYGNFTGGGINAVTRSGTNQLSGSAYFFTKNNALAGKDPITKAPTEQFEEYTVGFRLGGPVIKNKWFYFVNYEFLRNTRPSLFNAGDGSRLSKDSADWIVKHMRTKYNYDPGNYGRQSIVQQNHKGLVKFTYSINPKHKLSFRYSFVTGYKDALPRTQNLFTFANGGSQHITTQNAGVLELNATLGNNVSNNLIISYTALRDLRVNKDRTDFPYVQINTATQGNIVIGSSSVAKGNTLKQDIIELTDNLKLTHNNYTFTLGTHNECYLISYTDMTLWNGLWFSHANANVMDLTKLGTNNNGNNNEGLITRYRAAYPIATGGFTSRFSAAQFAAYAQAEGIYWNNRLRLSLGFRIDLPVFFNRPLNNVDFNTQFKQQNNFIPTAPLYSPRFGFHLEADKNRIVIIRGGVGLFSGRVPFVWISNAFADDGIRRGIIDITSDIPKFNPDVDAIPGLIKNTSFGVSSIDKNFRFPQVLRSNLAVDINMPGNILLSLEGIFTKTLNNLFYQKLGVTPDTHDTILPLGNRKIRAAKVDMSYRNTDGTINANRSYGGGLYHLKSTNSGYTYNLTARLSKTFSFANNKGGHLSLMAAYTYSRSLDIASNPYVFASSGYEFTYIRSSDNFNNPPLATSNYENRHRIIATLSYTIPYAQRFATAFFFFLRAHSGYPFTMAYNNFDLNGDGSTNNDILYIPSDTEIQRSSLNAQEKINLLNFINSSPVLQSQKGQFSQRNAFTTPWESIIDLRILQNIAARIKNKTHTFQISLEIFNLTNLLYKQWGRVYNNVYTSNNFVNPWSSSGVVRSSNNRPWTIQDTYSINFDSRWQLQLGFRYLF